MIDDATNLFLSSTKRSKYHWHIAGVDQNCSNSIANAPELLTLIYMTPLNCVLILLRLPTNKSLSFRNVGTLWVISWYYEKYDGKWSSRENTSPFLMYDLDAMVRRFSILKMPHYKTVALVEYLYSWQYKRENKVCISKKHPRSSHSEVHVAVFFGVNT